LKAPHVDEIKFLELAAKGVAPFYDEKVKRWYAPENPDLEAKMNERTQNLEAKEEESSFGGDNEFEDEISQLMNDKKAASKTADIESMPTSQVATKKASTKEAVKETVKTLDDNDGLGFDDDDLPF
jgi:transcriptional/translational regulatory protein YebC/TACO1